MSNTCILFLAVNAIFMIVTDCYFVKAMPDQINNFLLGAMGRNVDTKVRTELLLTERDLKVVCLTSGADGEGGSLWMVPLLMCQ